MSFKSLIYIVLLLSISFGAVTKQYTFKAPTVNNDIISMRGCHLLTRPFEPQVAVKPVTLLLPEGHEAIAVDVDYAEPVALNGSYYAKPFYPGGVIGHTPPKDLFQRKSAVYTTNEFYPQQEKKSRFYTQYKHGHALLLTSVYPVQVNPVTGTVRYFKKVTVTVETAKKRGPQTAVKTSPFILSQLKLFCDNPEALQNISFSKKGADDYEYLIITTEKLKNSWDTFLAFNKRRGLRSKIVTIEHIKANVSGSSSEDKAKKYVKDQYKEHNVHFVMLGGDDNFNRNNTQTADCIPHKSYSAAFYDYGDQYIVDKDIAADMFYECLDGNMLDDLAWEVYAARFAADNSTELNTIIQKTIKYSEDPNTSGLKKVVLAGEYLWKNVNGGECYGGDCMVYLKGRQTANNFTTEGIPTSWSFTQLFERHNRWTSSDIVRAINNNLHMVHHLGHSNNNKIWKMGNTEVGRCTNTSYFIGYTQGCYPGAYDNRNISFNASINSGHSKPDCIAEEFTVGSKNGAVAFISNCRFGITDNGVASPDGSDGGNTRLQRYFLDALFGKKLHYIAMMHAYSKEISKQAILDDVPGANNVPYWGGLRWAAYNANILGDPALSVWTEAPKTLEPTYALEGQKFTADTKNPYSWVALEGKEGTIVINQLTGEDGKCAIEDKVLSDYIAANQGTKMTVRIKAHNHLPFEGELDLATAIATNFAHQTPITKLIQIPGDALHINYSLTNKGSVSFALYNSKGALVKNIPSRDLDAGSHTLRVNSKGMGQGIYYYRLSINNAPFTGKLILN